MYIFKVHFKLDFVMESNNIDPDQTALWIDPDQTAPKEQSDLGQYCLQYRLPKNISKKQRLAR